MTDITTNTPVFLRHLSLRRLQFPNLRMCPKIEATSRAILRAFEMAYVVPFSAMQREKSIVLDEDLEGRDPNW